MVDEDNKTSFIWFCLAKKIFFLIIYILMTSTIMWTAYWKFTTNTL